jgi:tRNA(fMet)-specific endonuclease VapC
MKYMLDTDTISFALRGHGGVGDQIRARKPSELCMSAITLGELRYGAERKGSRRLHGLIDSFAATLEIASFDETAAGEYGRIACILADRGTPIGDFDVLIAAHAVSLQRTLVTNNLRHLSRVPGLSLESWV